MSLGKVSRGKQFLKGYLSGRHRKLDANWGLAFTVYLTQYVGMNLIGPWY